MEKKHSLEHHLSIGWPTKVMKIVEKSDSRSTVSPTAGELKIVKVECRR
jgi:hypothetical protein